LFCAETFHGDHFQDQMKFPDFSSTADKDSSTYCLTIDGRCFALIRTGQVVSVFSEFISHYLMNCVGRYNNDIITRKRSERIFKNVK